MIRALAPRFWGLHLLAVVLVAVTVWLGLWQLHTWQAQRAAEERDLSMAEPVALEDVLGPDDPFPGTAVGQPVVLSGRWIPDSTLYVSDREQDGQRGYWAVTPMQVGPDDAAVLVVRGWARSLEQIPAPPQGPAELVAWLQPPEGTGVTDDDPTDDVLPQLRLADAVQHVDQDLYGAYAVVADTAAPGEWPVGDRALNPGSDRLETAALDKTPGAGELTGVRNLLYAVQWWIFGGFVVFVWWRHLRDTLAAEDAAALAAVSGGEPPAEVGEPDDHVPSTP